VSEGVDESPGTGLEISSPASSSVPKPDPTWSLVANNKRVLADWVSVCQTLHENAIRCYEWLRAHPTRGIPRRCYALKHKNYAGAWCYEIGSGHRVYYKPRADRKDVLIYYAGPHPKSVPYPPK